MDVNKCKRSLKAYKGHLTRATSDSENLLAQDDVHLSEIKEAIKFLEQKWTSFDEAYNKLELAMLEEDDTEEELEKEQAAYYKFRLSYQQLVTKLRNKERSVEKQDSSASTDKKSSTEPAMVRPKLPTIQLPTFSGELSEYEAFMDQFQAQIGMRSDLEPVTKLQYLKSQLKGKALALIQGYSSTSDNYQCAMETLKETYGDEEKIKHHLLQKIINIDSPKHNKTDLETFRVTMLNLTRSLKNKHNYECCEWIVASLFQHKLSTATIRQLYLKYESNFFDLAELNEGLRELISHMETECNGKPNKAPKSDHFQGNSDRSKDHNIGTYYTTEHRPKPKSGMDIKCRFCGAGHRDSQCTKFTTGWERIKRVKELKQCLRCMGSHLTKDCRVNLQVCRRCQKGYHHTTLCKSFDNVPSSSHTKQEPNTSERPSTNSSPSNIGHVNITTGSATSKPSGAALSTAMAKLVEKRQVKDVRILFDNGSQKTFITREVVEKMGIPRKTTANMTLNGFMSQPNTQDFEVVKTIVKMGNRRKRITAVVVDELPRMIVTAGLTEVIKHLTRSGLKLADPEIKNDRVGPTDILIGSDHYFDFIALQTIQHSGVHLSQSPGGYIITGKIPSQYDTRVQDTTSSETVTPESVLVLKITEDLDPIVGAETHLDELTPVHKLWDLDVIGVDASQPLPEDRISYQEYLNTVKYEDGKYSVKLPWKLNKPELPNNYHRALGQMYSLVTELNKKNKLDQYQKILDEQVEAGFIEEVPMADPNNESHYLPHHAVVKDSATTPLRIVFNCSAKASSQAASLNDCLMTGPTLTNKLGDVLLKFRLNPHAYTADISKAFLRIGLQEEDRDFTRFLWPEDPYNPHSRIKTYRFRSVLFGATSSPFLLQATVDYHLRKCASPIKDILADNFYVDNFQGTAIHDDSLMTIYKEANKELQLANMPLRQWSTNNKNLQTIIKQDFQGYEAPRVTNVLGLQWDTQDDTLNLKPVMYPEGQPATLTKRQLLSKVSKMFDPLGLLTPVTIKGKLLLQEAWKLQVDWDEALPEYFTDQWELLRSELQQLADIKLPRAVCNESEQSTLHIFCDASLKAYGAAAYLTNQTQSLLLTSRTRVAPLKPRTIPQLELTAILVGTKLANYIHQTLNQLRITSTYVWSDNEAALQWIRNNNSNIPYVRNRVADILEAQKVFHFLHVATKSNPADMLSRGTTVTHLIRDNLWFHGPDWLNNADQWPEQKTYVTSTINVTQEVEVQSTKQTNQLIDYFKFSSLGKLLRVTRKVFKFITNIYEKKRWTLPTQVTCPVEYWVKIVQSECYQQEHQILLSLSSNNSNSLPSESSTKTLTTHNDSESSTKTLGVETKKSGSSTKTPRTKVSKLNKDLGLFLDARGVIRCQGRIHNSTLQYGAKHPILLPKDHWFTHLVICNSHLDTLHGGVANTLVDLRKSFWIPKARQVIKTCIRKCIICRRYDSRPLQYPEPPPLPKERLQETKPFQVVGVDYTGAIQLQNPSGDINSEPTKVYICLFTCATTRAVHLELATDLTANTFLQAFRRFTGRRSCPQLIISDNGSNFRATEILLRGFFQLPEVLEYFETRKCDWRFIAPRAPWQGGFYERMIGVVKRCLRKVLHNKRVTIEELRTLLVEIEARVNNRPLTYIQEDIDEPEALTPNHLLQGSLIDIIPPLMNNEVIKDPDYLLSMGSSNSENLRARFNHLNKILCKWNKVWRTDYLTSLREHHYGKRNSSTSNPVKPGDLVLVDCDTYRSTWPLGKIISLLPNPNGSVRVVKVLCKGKITIRTIDKLIPLEISSVEHPEDTPNQTVQRPSRKAAQKARNQIKNQHEQGVV